MDIIDRLNKLKGSLNNIQGSLSSDKEMKTPSEIGLEEEIPEVEEDIFAGLNETPEAPAEVPPEDLEVSNIEGTDEDIPDEAEEEEEIEDVVDATIADAPEQPKERIWEPITPPDGDMKGISFKSNKENINLDMKRIDMIDRLWIARLYQGEKLLEYGQIIVPKNIDDPITYVQDLANAMLDNKSMRYEQEWQEYYATKREKKEEAKEEVADIGTEAKEEDVFADLLGNEEKAKEGEEDVLAGLGEEEAVPKEGEEVPKEGEEEDVLADLFK